jgi:polyisoprenoid-binding protein YceI
MRTSFLLALLTALSMAPADAADYRLDPVHCQVLFFADHLGFSKQMGRFTGVRGTFSYDPENPAAARTDVEIDVTSLWLGDAEWEKKMRSRDFFDAERHPTMRFVSTRFEPTGERTAVLRGDLTLRDVTRPVELTVTINRIGRNTFNLKQTAGFSARGSLRRSEFGMTRLPAAIGDEVEIRLEIEGVRDGRDPDDALAR